MEPPKHWIFKNWAIERDCSGDFWIAPVGSRKQLIKARSLVESKAVVNQRIAAANAIQDQLKSAGVVSIKDLDLIRGCNSRFDALAAIVGSEQAHQIFHAISV